MTGAPAGAAPPAGLELRWEVTDAYSGQVNERGTAFIDGRPVAYLHMSVFCDRPSISMIEVAAGFLRLGIASSMVRAMQERFPNTEIDWGCTTPSGAALKAALPYREVVDEDVRARRIELEARQRQVQAYEARCETHDAIESHSDEQRSAHRQWLNSIAANWTELHDRVWELTQELQSGPAEVRRLVLSEADAESAGDREALDVDEAQGRERER